MAERIKFTKDLDAEIPGTRNHIAYKSGMELTVPQWVADLAISTKSGHVVADRSKAKNDDA